MIMKSRVKGASAFAATLVIALTLWLGFASLCAALGDFGWPLELFAHFRPQWAALALVALLASLALRHGPLILVNVVLLAANVVPLFPHLMSYVRAPATAEATGRSLRVLSLNLHANGTQLDHFGALLDKESPDVVVLTEMHETFGNRMGPLLESYPYKLVGRGGPGRFHEINIYSRWPLGSVQTTRVSALQLPVISVGLCPPSGERGACLQVVALHGMAPFGEGAKLRAQQLDAAARAVAGHLGPALMIGDLNMTPWSPTFRKLLDSTRLKDASVARGIAPTWAPRSWSERVRGFTEDVAPFLGLSIDHALVTPDIAVRDSRIGPMVGSDHWPIIVDLQLPDLAQPRF
ncbi:MAG: endonuclease/exonuclease/phosphatase family protein [Alphaproteobacteria bacterium]